MRSDVLNGRSLAPLYVALAAFALALATPPSDPDMYWHLASGKWMLDHGALLHTDVFSSTVNGQPYSIGEWLGEIVLYVAYLAGGWTGLVILRGLLVGVCAFFLTRVALRGGAPIIVAVPVTCAALLLSEIVWTDRPHLFTLALFPLLLDLLLTARAGRLGVLLGVPPLMLLWTNLHGGYALGLVLVGIFALEALLTRRNFAAFAITASTAFAASLVDPGSLGLGAAAAHATAPPRFIVEESPPDVTRPAGFVFAAFIIGTLALAVRGGGTLLDLLLTARAGRVGLLLGVPPMMLLWTNLHGGYAIGLVLVGIFTLEALLTRRNFAAFAITASTAFAASLVDPGSLGLGAAAAHATAPPRFIVEESPPDVTRPAGFVFAAFIIGTLALGMRGGGTLLDLLLLAPLLWLGLSAQRHMPYFAFAAVPFISAALPRAWPPLEAWLARRRRSRRSLRAGTDGGARAMPRERATLAARRRR